jgi:hypothetical protein
MFRFFFFRGVLSFFSSVCPLGTLFVRARLLPTTSPTHKKKDLSSPFFFVSERRVTTANCLLEEKKEKKRLRALFCYI